MIGTQPTPSESSPRQIQHHTNHHHLPNATPHFPELSLHKFSASSSASRSTFEPTEGLVHPRLQQLVFEWLLLPQTAALVRQLQEDSATNLPSSRHHHEAPSTQSTTSQGESQSIDRFSMDGYNKDIPPGSPFPSKSDHHHSIASSILQTNRRLPASPAALSSPSQIFISRTTTSPTVDTSLTLLPALSDSTLQESSPTHGGNATRSATLLPTSLEFNSALCSPIHPPRSPARRGPPPPSGPHRHLSDPNVLPPPEDDFIPSTASSPSNVPSATQSASNASPRPTPTGASTALVGALLKTAAASSAEGISSADRDTPMVDVSISIPPSSTSTPISDIIAAGVQELDRLDLSGMDARLERISAELDQSTSSYPTAASADFQKGPTPSAEIRPQANQQVQVSKSPKLESKTSPVVEGHTVKERRTRQDDFGAEIDAKRQKPSPVLAPKDATSPLLAVTLHLPDEASQQNEALPSALPTSIPPDTTPIISITLPSLTEVASPKIPQFFKPKFRAPTSEIGDETKAAIDRAFEDLPSSESVDVPDGMDLPTFESRVIVDLLKMSKFLSEPVFAKIDTQRKGYITKSMLVEFWEGRLILGDDTNNFFHLVRQDEFDFIWGYDFGAFIQNILDRHPGMEFLKETSEFQKRYTTTVIARLLYVLDPYGSGKMTLPELRRFDRRQQIRAAEHAASTSTNNNTTTSDNPITILTSLAQIWKSLDTSSDLNHERLFFSYEHFYVIYCTFWELDANHDFQLDQQDLLKYDSHALCARTINRVISRLTTTPPAGAINSNNNANPLISYEEFVVFLLNDEDKTSDRSLEFWFDIVDLDGDGYIRYYEMQYFYEEQCQRLEALNHEVVPFSDILCQMNDFLKPKIPAVFTLTDFKRNRKTSGVFFDILLSLTKFVAYEVRDPFQLKQELTDFPDFSAWDRFCRREYDKLAIEEEGDDDEDDDSRDDIAEWGSSPGIHHDGSLIDDNDDDDDDDDDDQLIVSTNDSRNSGSGTLLDTPLQQQQQIVT